MVRGQVSLSYFENNIYYCGFFECPKVFAKVKNGQKKCPILEKPGIFEKHDFQNCVLDQNAHNTDFFI